MGTLNSNIYTIKVSDILLNNNSNDVITITVDDINKELIIDYTNLFKVNINVTIIDRDLRNGNTYTVESHLYGNVAKTGCYHSTKVYRQDAIQG